MADYQVLPDYSEDNLVDCPHCDGHGQVKSCVLCDEEIYGEQCDCEDFKLEDIKMIECSLCDGSGMVDLDELRDYD